MNISYNPTFIPNIQYSNSTKLYNKVNFKGNLGDKFVRDVTNMTNVSSEDVLKELKGTFGFKTEKVQDVLDSFIDSLKNLTLRNKELESNLEKANIQIASFPQQKREAVDMAESQLNKSYQSVIDSKNKEVEAAKLETKEAQIALEKYKPVVNVKSVEEVAPVMPEQALQVLNEMVEHKAIANKSMSDFLLTGKGQEEALAQIERNNILLKAGEDGIMNIPSIQNQYKEISRKHNIYYSSDQNMTLNLIEKSLMSDVRGESLSSRSIREQVTKNAMALLTPMANENHSNTGLKSLENKLDERLDNVIKFHDGFRRGIEKTKDRYKNCSDFEIVINRVENDVDESKVVYKYFEKSSSETVSWENTFSQVANQGNSSW